MSLDSMAILDPRNPVPPEYTAIELPEPDESEYTIGWVSALEEDYAAAVGMLDYKFKGPKTLPRHDSNVYQFGKIYDHNVIITCLPDGTYGESKAVLVTNNLIRSFPNLRFALMVGIGGGAPTEDNDIRLGDVVIGKPEKTHPGVVQLDLVKRKEEEGEVYYERVGAFGPPPDVLRTAQMEVKRRYHSPCEPDRIAENIHRVQSINPRFNRPTTEDRLFLDDYDHIKDKRNCNECDPSKTVSDRDDQARAMRLNGRAVGLHFGTIGTSNSIIESPKERNRYSQDPQLNIICFETEAAGVISTFPCMVIRGISHYCDTHATDEWQAYAGLSAAAYARELLSVVRPEAVFQNNRETLGSIVDDGRLKS